ncbi:hypothetical protein SBA2_490029 [Acidobacteriia bacterium SbA2]|nr:hypothetical protein SBA2_490029 [Acidobacteriia bacterium SbA2]
MDSRLRGNDVIFGGAGDGESRSAVVFKARFFVQFTLIGRARSFAPLGMTSDGIRMTAKGSE